MTKRGPRDRLQVAGAHILMLGSYVEYGSSSEQYEWLVRDLARVDRSRTPWLIAVLHAPWYSSNLHHYGEGDDMMASMEDLLYENGLDLLLAGHVHAYERSVPVLRGRPHRCGATHIVVGDGGNREGLDTSYVHPAPAWSAMKEASYGMGLLQLLNATHAVWEWHRNSDGTFEAGDRIVLERTPECRGGSAVPRDDFVAAS
jgi:acid phosphatase type 7